MGYDKSKTFHQPASLHFCWKETMSKKTKPLPGSEARETRSFSRLERYRLSLLSASITFVLPIRPSYPSVHQTKHRQQLSTGYFLSTDSAQQEDHLTDAISSHRPNVTFPKKLTLLQNVTRSGLIGDRQFDRMSNVFDNRRIMVLLCHHVDE